MSIDIVSFGETMLRLAAPEGARLEDAGTLNVYVGGTESNTLSTLARLKLKTNWISALPAHPIGRHVETELRRHGIDTSDVIWTANTTRLGIFYSEEAPAPLGVQVYYDRANSACALIDPEAVNYAAIDQARLLLLTGITPALSEQAHEVFRRFLRRAHEKGIALSFDVNYRGKLWTPEEAAAGVEEACRQADLLFCTRADATELWHITGSPEAMLQQMARRFTLEGQHKTLILTLGSEGSAQLQDGVYSSEPAFPAEGTARFGSGDAFAAGYLYAHLKGPLYYELCGDRAITPLAFGNALAAIKRCISGDIGRINPEDVRGILQKGGRFR